MRSRRSQKSKEEETPEVSETEENASESEEESEDVKKPQVEKDSSKKAKKGFAGATKDKRKAKKILIIESDFAESSSELQILDLPHPGRRGSSAKFMFNPKTGQLREIMTFEEPNRSWFMGDTVENDGRLLLASHVDPVLFVMPFLATAERVQPLDQIVKDDSFPHLAKLFENSSTLKSSVSRIADRKGPEDLNAWKFNEEKCLNYLARKVDRVAGVLKENEVNVRDGSGNYVKSLNTEIERKEYVKFAFGILSEYLEKEEEEESSIFSKLKKKLDIKDEVPTLNKTKSENKSQTSTNKKRTSEGPLEDYSKNFKKAKSEDASTATAKQKALARSATGSKSIMSFFGKKN